MSINWEILTQMVGNVIFEIITVNVHINLYIAKITNRQYILW